MPDPPQNIQGLLRLKRYERPPDGYFEQFLSEFQARQRSELMRVSSWQLLRDRLAASLHEVSFLLEPRWTTGAAAAAALVLAGLYFGGSQTDELAASPNRPSSQAGTAREPLHASGIRPINTNDNSRTKSPPGVVHASREQASLEDGNGLRRRPADQRSRLKGIPMAGDDADDNLSPARNSGQVIILVR